MPSHWSEAVKLLWSTPRELVCSTERERFEELGSAELISSGTMVRRERVWEA